LAFALALHRVTTEKYARLDNRRDEGLFLPMELAASGGVAAQYGSDVGV
jgi:hypothetical protein